MSKKKDKMKKGILITIVLSLNSLQAIDTGSISGRVIDKSTNAPLVGVNLVLEKSGLGAATDLSGHYYITNIPQGTYKLIVSMIGYKSDTFSVAIKDEQTILNISLEPEIIELPEVVISGERLAERSSVSDHIIEGKCLLTKEGQMQDPIRVVSTLPGIATLGDLFSPSQPYVRGGNPDENLFLLDWTKVHWPWLFGGMKSVFNSETIDKIELLTGGFPAKYGDCLSSVFNITTREGNRKRFGGNVSLGFINTQALLEGPITPKGSFLFAGRRTYLDLVMGKEAEFPVPYFWDANFKFTYEPKFGQKFHLSGLTTYERIDFYTPDPKPGMPEKIYDLAKLNTQTLEWKNLIRNNIYSVSAITREEGDWNVEIGRIMKMDGYGVVLGFIKDLTWGVNPLHEIKTGGRIGIGRIDFKMKVPEEAYQPDPNIDPNDPTTPLIEIECKDTTWHASWYLQNSWSPLHNISLTPGVRVDYWESNKNTDVSPRVAIKYDITEGTAIRAACGLYTQNPDAVFYGKSKLESQKCIHYIIGITREFGNVWHSWLELYKKDYYNLVVRDTLGNYSNKGKGFAQGLEVFLKKNVGSITGWLSYSLSLSKRQGYYSDFDQPHMLSLVLDWTFLKRFTLDMQFRFASGRPYTPIIGAEKTPDGIWRPIKGENNSERYTPFHQLNVRFAHKFSVFGLKGLSYFEVWNLYNRKNVMGYVYKYGEEYTNNVKKIPYYSTPFIPSGGFRIEF